MRKAFSSQFRLDCLPIEQVRLNFECRDEIIPILAALKYVFEKNDLTKRLTDLVAADINETARDDIGREGFDYWQIIVLAAVRLGCNLDYDKLQDLCENHRSLRGVLGIGDWDETTHFGSRRIRDTLRLLKPTTLKKINELIAADGQFLHGNAREKVRADSFVVETNIHPPTESTLIWDGIRKIIPLCCELALLLNVSGWRQARHLQKCIKDAMRNIGQIVASKSPKAKAKLPDVYQQLLQRAATVLQRAKSLQKQAQNDTSDLEAHALAIALEHWIGLTERVCDTAYRRVTLGEKVPNSEKLFSLFETHTQLYRRGKAGQPNQFGRLVLIFEDAAGFISHYHLMDRESQDKDVIVEQTETVQKLHQGEIQDASFDRGFFSKENEEQLKDILDHPCLPPRHPMHFAEWLIDASVRFRNSRKRHSGIESAIGALQSGNGLKRCRDRTEVGFERYLGLAVLGRNLHVLGKLLIARENENAQSVRTKRKAA